MVVFILQILVLCAIIIWVLTVIIAYIKRKNIRKRAKTELNDFKSKISLIDDKKRLNISELKRKVEALAERKQYRKLVDYISKSNLKIDGILKEQKIEFENYQMKKENARKQIKEFKKNGLNTDHIEKKFDENTKSALNDLEELKKKHERYIKLTNMLAECKQKTSLLTKRVADGELSSSAYERARSDLENEIRNLEEEIWKLRNMLFKDEYEKPF